VIRGLEPGSRPALLISECQRGILDASLTTLPVLAEQAAERGILPRIGGLASAFRDAGRPVFHLHIALRADFAGVAVSSPLAAVSRRERKMVGGTADSEPMPDVVPVDGDVVCARRSGLVAWYGTDLDAMLRHQRIGTLVIVGVSTNLAVFGAALGGVDRGYQVVIAEDCTAGGSTESHEFMVTQSLPLLAAMSDAAAVSAALAELD
jgi:nicotinamidase-related amidase